ncbi:hypothetical protein [Bacillus altitudinis]
MNYLKEINGFMRWLETSPLKPTTQALWLQLMDINNGCRWREWFTVSNTTLVARFQCLGETVLERRKILVEAGESNTSRKEKKAGRYRIISLEAPQALYLKIQKKKKPTDGKTSNL